MTWRLGAPDAGDPDLTADADATNSVSAADYRTG